jgi:hypothetical protein
MPYVSRADDGDINGLFVNFQPGFAEEWLENDDPTVVAYLESTTPKPELKNEAMLFDHENRLRAIEGEPPLTLTDFLVKMKGA